VRPGTGKTQTRKALLTLAAALCALFAVVCGGLVFCIAMFAMVMCLLAACLGYIVVVMSVFSDRPLDIAPLPPAELSEDALRERIEDDLAEEGRFCLSPAEMTLLSADTEDETERLFQWRGAPDDVLALDLIAEEEKGDDAPEWIPSPLYVNLQLGGEIEIAGGRFRRLTLHELRTSHLDFGSLLPDVNLSLPVNMARAWVSFIERSETGIPLEPLPDLAFEDGELCTADERLFGDVFGAEDE